MACCSRSTAGRRDHRISSTRCTRTDLSPIPGRWPSTQLQKPLSGKRWPSADRDPGPRSSLASEARAPRRRVFSEPNLRRRRSCRRPAAPSGPGCSSSVATALGPSVRISASRPITGSSWPCSALSTSSIHTIQSVKDFRRIFDSRGLAAFFVQASFTACRDSTSLGMHFGGARRPISNQ